MEKNMLKVIATPTLRALWAGTIFILVEVFVLWKIYQSVKGLTINLTNGEIVRNFIGLPGLAAIGCFIILTACASKEENTAINFDSPASPTESTHLTQPFIAQVVGLQWLNPLQRRDYPTEWQLLWAMGMVRPNKDDDMVRAKPGKYSTLQAIGSIAIGNDGRETFAGYHEKYILELIIPMHDIYFSRSSYFYNAHSLKDRSTWRELAGIHIEYALPTGRLSQSEAAIEVRNNIVNTFSIGNPSFPTTWSRSTPPDVRVTVGGANAGFTSLSAALDYLQAHPNETVWAMNWDAPNFPPNDEQINENMVLLVLAGPHYKTERDPLAWIGYPATHDAADFEKKSELPPRVVQAWQATLDQAVHNAGKTPIDIGYVIHDANNTQADSSDRLGNLAHILTTQVAEFDFARQAFNTPALLGEMGAGTALTNVALAIAYANHLGKNVLVAGTSELAKPTAVLVVPPAKVRPIEADKDWFRARGENNAHLMWWGIRHDAEFRMQGYSK